ENDFLASGCLFLKITSICVQIPFMSNTQFTAKLLILAGLFLSSCMPAKKVTFTPITDADLLPHPIPEDSIPTIPGTETFIPDPRDSFFLDLFAQHPGIFEEIVLKKDLLQVQILYTQIDRDEHNMP